MARFRNDFGEDRVAPMLGYTLVPAGQTITVPDSEWDHWDAGGWTALDPKPAPPPQPDAQPEAAAAEPAPAPAKTTTKSSPAPEGTDTP